MSDRAFPFSSGNQRQSKPRSRGLTEIRGPYYTPMGKRSLQDVLETMGEYVDSLKFAGGSFTLMPRPALVELLNLCHEHNVLVSTGGPLEYVLTQGAVAVDMFGNAARWVSTSARVRADSSPFPLTTGCGSSRKCRGPA